MNTANAIAFCLLGAGMFFMPEMLPAWFAGAGTGTNTSALWLQLMGGVNGTTGAAWLVRMQVLPAAGQVLAWRPALPPAMEPAQLLRPAMEFYEEIEEEISGAAVAEEREGRVA